MTLADRVNEMIRFALLSMTITSAGGDSPKINKLRPGTLFQQVNLETEIEADVERIVKKMGSTTRRQVSIGGDIPTSVQQGMAFLGKTPDPSGKNIPKGTLRKILEKDLGASKGKQALAFLLNPRAAAMDMFAGVVKGKVGKMGGIIMAVLASPLIFQQLMQLLTKRGQLFDLTFRNRIDDRINVLRTRQSQMEISRAIEGKSQVILTTRAGTVDPIFSFNTYELRNTDALEFAKLYSVRSVWGAP